MNKILNLILALMVLSCSSTTIIKSQDKDAEIRVNGRLVGTGTVIHTDKKVAWFGKNQVELSKKGCAEKTYVFKRNEEIDYQALVFGVFLLVPLVWIMQYQAVHEYDYSCKKKAAN